MAGEVVNSSLMLLSKFIASRLAFAELRTGRQGSALITDISHIRETL